MKKTSLTYSEKLKDPRWQKMRLQVMERDYFSCLHCHSQDKTLNVHHTYYEPNRMPWDYPIESFMTVCEDCHEEIRIATRDVLVAFMRVPPKILRAMAWEFVPAGIAWGDDDAAKKLICVLRNWERWDQMTPHIPEYPKDVLPFEQQPK